MGGMCISCGRHCDPIEACSHCGNVPKDPDPIAAAKARAAEIKKRTAERQAEIAARIEAEAKQKPTDPRKDAA